MGSDNNIRISNAIDNELYTLVVVGSFDFMRPEKKTIDWKVEAQVDASVDLVSGSVKASYGEKTEFKSRTEFWKTYMYTSDTRLIDLKDDGINYLSFYMGVGYKGNVLVPIAENLLMESHPHGYVFYLWDNRVRMGVLQQGKNFRMLEGNSGIAQERNYPPHYACPECKQEI